MKALVIRHLETEENQQGIIQGHLHGTPSVKGIREAYLTGIHLKNEPVKHIYGGTLERNIVTAQNIQASFPGVTHTQHHSLNERYFGPAEGRVAREIDFDLLKPQFEPVMNTRHRMKQVFEMATKKHGDDTVVFVVHSIAILVMLADELGFDPEKYYEEGPKLLNCSITRLNLEIRDALEITIEDFNNVEHLKSL